ncbi:sugar transferase [Sporomusa sphaeroides]
MFTLPGVIVLLPVFLIIALWIKLDSRGPVFFRQVRVGQYGKPFKIFKFRTMIVDAESHGTQITVGQDKRITRIGEILRKYKLDELPQLFNIILGDMSLVGPRPEVPRYMNEYPDDIRQITLSVKPGITDLASITFKDENAMLGKSTCPEQTYIREILPVKQKYYVQYVTNRSIIFDIVIIAKTFSAILFRDGAKNNSRNIF